MSKDQVNSDDRQPADLSRRQWLLKLGETAVLLGFSETIAGSPAGETTLPLDATAQDVAGLPPGLYEPSSDHLAHALASDSLLHAIPPGTETDYVRPHSGPYHPQFFSHQEFQTIRRIVELMLGEADDGRVAPSQGDDHENIIAVVAEWIDLRIASAPAVRESAHRLAPEHRALAVAYDGSPAVEELENREPERTIREGLAWLADESSRRYSKPFLDLGVDRQVGLWKEISDDRRDQTNETAGTRLFNLMKHEIIRGFYTSRMGLKELDYKKNAFYAESPGCPGHDHSASLPDDSRPSGENSPKRSLDGDERHRDR